MRFLHKNKYTIDEVVQYITQKDDVSHMTIERKAGLLMAHVVVTLEELKRIKEPNKPVELYPDKPMPLCDLMDMLPIFVEHRFTGEIVGSLYNTKKDMFLFFDEDGEKWMDNEEQGQTWRAWLVYPSAEERAAAPWKELKD